MKTKEKKTKSKTQATKDPKKNIPAYNENKHQLVIYENRVLESSPVPPDYPGRDWRLFKSLEEFTSFCKENGAELAKDFAFSVIFSKSDHQIINCNIGSSFVGVPEEKVFETAEDAKSYIDTMGVKPSIYVLPPDYREQVDNFFADKICFFRNYETIYRSYKGELDMIKVQEPESLPLLKKKYEHIIIDTLYEIDYDEGSLEDNFKMSAPFDETEEEESEESNPQ
jgi:hypothetical protein